MVIKQREEMIRPSEFLQGIRHSELLQEIRPSGLLQRIRPSELLQEEERNQRVATLANWIRNILFDLNQRKEMIRPSEFLQGANLKADTREEKMTVEKQEVYLSNRRSFYSAELSKNSLILAPFFLPLAGGTGHGGSQPEHQSHSEIYPSTLNVVSNCPSRGEYMQTSITKCAGACGSNMQDGDCAYHCMRDSSKTKLVEFCAKPKLLFEYCPEYDPVDQTIQKDVATLCNSTSSRNYYNSSDIFFCDPNNCLQLHAYESSVRSGATTLTTLMNETTDMNGGDNQEWFLPLAVLLAAFFLAITIGSIHVVVKRGIFSVCSTYHKMTTKRNQNDRQHP